MLYSVLLLVVGLVLLIKGADWLVDGASALAKRYHVSDLAIGLTVVAFGTSAPELVVNIVAAINGYQGIAFGNVIGSNNFNLFLILGVSGLILPLSVQKSTAWKEIPFSLLVALLLIFMVNVTGKGYLSRFEGLILFAFFIGFLYYIFAQMRTVKVSIELKKKQVAGFILFLLIAGGLTSLIAGGKLVVDSAVKIATAMGISQEIIGLTIVAAGTSLPELATSVVAALKKNADIAVGNIIGSNIFNILLILAVSATIRPLNYDMIFNRDLIFLSFGTVFLFLAMFTGKRRTLDRWEAGILLVAFIAYSYYRLLNS
ncbi:MAG: calcium/sodium antiporter [Bacteroidales bacterium]